MRYQVKAGEVSAVEDVTFTVHEGEAVGLVGESGCGKTSVALSLLRLLPDNAKFVSGEIRLDGTDLIALTEEEMRQRRWNDIAMVFQGAMNSWNPVQRVGDQIKEAMDTHFPGEDDLCRGTASHGGTLPVAWDCPPRCSIATRTSSPEG